MAQSNSPRPNKESQRSSKYKADNQTGQWTNVLNKLPSLTFAMSPSAMILTKMQPQQPS